MKECRTYTRSLYFSLAMDDIQLECPVVPTILHQAITLQSGMSFRTKNFEADVSTELQLITNSNIQDV
jgi:hypothetical protein